MIGKEVKPRRKFLDNGGKEGTRYFRDEVVPGYDEFEKVARSLASKGWRNYEAKH